MKSIMLVLGVLFLLSASDPFSLSHAQMKGKEDWVAEATKIRAKHVSPDDMEKWKKRFELSLSKGTNQSVALCLNVIGILHYLQGDLDGSMKFLGECIQVSRQHRFEMLAMISLNWLAMVQKDAGLTEESMRNGMEALALAEKLQNQEAVGKSCLSIGTALAFMGRNEEAMTYLERSLSAAMLLGDKTFQKGVLSSMGRLYLNQGDYPRARECFSRSLKISEELQDKGMIINCLWGLGEISESRKEYKNALEYFMRAAALSEELGNKLAMGATHRRIGAVYASMNDGKKALEHFEKADRLARDLGSRSLLATISLGKSRALAVTKNWDQAIKETDQAMDLLKTIQVPGLTRLGYALRGQYQENKGNLVEAEANYRESVKLLESLREGAAGGEEGKLSFEEATAPVYERLINILLRQGKVPEAMNYLERSRLKKFRDQFDQLKPTLSSKEEEQARQKEEKLMLEIGSVQELLNQELSKPKEQQNSARIEELERRLSARKQDYIEYVNDLREKFPELASLVSIQPDSLIDLQALLPPQAAIVQYLILNDRLFIFVVTGKTSIYKEVKVSQEELEGKVDTLRGFLMDPQIPAMLGPLDPVSLKPQDQSRADLFDEWIQPLMKVSEELRGLLLQPVEAEIAPFAVLGIIPNGKLHLLPFQALGRKSPDGRFRFLIEEKSLFQLNSQSILKFAQKRATQLGTETRLVAFGNPDNSLKYAEEEVQIIKKLFSNAKAYLRQDASKEKLQKGLESYDILHLATHGRMKDDIKQSYVVMARSPDGKDDGKLSLREIWGLNLKGYQLVTLSACETAVGKEASGDTIVSLETAFLRAGSATIVASLWGVDDLATGALMERFYENLRSNGKAESLRAAQISLRNDPRFAYPFYWAPFILVGDWR